LSIDDTEKNKHKKYEATKDKSILLQKIENKNNWKISKNEQGSTQDAVLSVIYINLYFIFLFYQFQYVIYKYSLYLSYVTFSIFQFLD